MITLRRANERHHSRRQKRDLWSTFYSPRRADPLADGFGPLATLEEDRLPPGASVPYHHAPAEEVITYVREGALSQKDSMSCCSGVIHAGEFQRMTAGRGSRHSERNSSRTDWAHVFRISIHTGVSGPEPSHKQKRFSAAERRGVLCVVASPDGRKGSLRIRQNAQIYSAMLDPGQHLIHELSPGRSAWLHVVRGEVTVPDDVLTAGDGVGYTAERAVSFTAREESEVLLFDLGERLPTSTRVAAGFRGLRTNPRQRPRLPLRESIHARDDASEPRVRTLRGAHPGRARPDSHGEVLVRPRERPLGADVLPPRGSSSSQSWMRAVAAYRNSTLRRSVWQIVNTLVPYVALWVLMIWTVDVSYWITLALAIVAAGFLARTFIILHDCGHGSFLESRRGNDFWGFVTGVLTFTPYRQWRHLHALHHATSGDLDRRGPGDIWTMTVQEYLDASSGKRFAYRLARNPFVLFVLAPFYVFLIQQRFPSRSVHERERRGVHWTNGAILAIAVLMSLTVGLKVYLLIQFPVIMFAAAAGVWLFYVQHQFEGVYWERRANWNFADAALRGSSFYKLPRVLQWFTGNIGFHHIHHLSPTIPNYNLEKCHKGDSIFQRVKQVTLWASLKTLSLRLWDERRKELVGYGCLRDRRGEGLPPA